MTPAPVRVARTYAVIVGIEAYAHEKWNLDGPTRDAVEFADWLIGHGVEPDHITMFSSPVPGNAACAPCRPIATTAATSTAIQQYFKDVLPQIADIDLLYVFWGGHGLSEISDERYLLCHEATPESPWSMGLTEMLTALRSRTYANIRSNVVIVDACATFRSRFGIEKIPAMSLAIGQEMAPSRQFVMFASQPGQAAKNVGAQRTGLLSRELRKVLTGTPRPFPPDMSAVAQEIRAAFEELRDTKEARQVPHTFEYVTESNDRVRKVFGTQPCAWTSEKAGRLYNREVQEGEFSLIFPERLSRKVAAQTYFVYGEKWEQHDSFARRLVDQYVDPFMSKALGVDAGGIGWLEATVAHDIRGLKLLQQRIRIGFGAQSTPATAFDRGRALIANVDELRNREAIVCLIDMKIARWDSDYPAFMNWYIDEYWAALEAEPANKPVVSFFMIELPEAAERPSLIDRLRTHFGPTLKERIVRLVHGTERDAVATMSQLTSLEIDHVDEWFRSILREPGLTPFKRREAAAELWAQAKPRSSSTSVPRTDSIESLLIDRYEAHTSLQGIP
ncbi:MAG: proteinCaspase protein [Gemmatimonadetes bacterium]|nr:proteinCaspase protein [Gemmatimonadota bacterium]